MKDRLIELLDGFVLECVNNCPKIIEGTRKCHKCAYGKIADYLIANGVIVPPCKVGDNVWIIDCYNKIQKCEIFSVNYYKNRNDDMWLYGIKTENFITLAFEDDDIGKTVFLTREEAEKALKRKDEGK